jgi:putative GTP pyrophosphokinase
MTIGNLNKWKITKLDIKEILSAWKHREKDYRHSLNEIYYLVKNKFNGEIYTTKRIKDKNSLKAKILQKTSEKSEKYKYIREFNFTSIVSDLGGIRFLYVFPDDIIKLHNIITSTKKFKVIKRCVYIKTGEFYFKENFFKSLGFNSTEIDKTKPTYTSIHYDIKYNDKIIEIQLRNIIDESYLQIDHKIKYKNNNITDKTELESDLHSLSSLASNFATQSKTIFKKYSSK